MLKFAAAAVVCSVGLIGFTETAQAKCCKKNKCGCAPAPSCCAPACSAPAPTCGAPAPAAAAPAAAPYESPAPPTPPAASTEQQENAAPKVSQDASDRQTFRNFSFDSNETASPAPAAAPAAAPAVNQPANQKKKSPGSNMFRANRKMEGVRTY